ncbi:hypothetical protein CBS101457_000823 [Exobasidium rhododendri]|nr:hypothetical protein CBS101457_000823 [Exobasidium rhododendri]
MASAGTSSIAGGKEREEEEELPTSHLTRPSPDAILADEADETNLLGNESDSEAGSSRRGSTDSRIEATVSSKRSSQIVTTVGEKLKDNTPTQSSFPSKANSVIYAAPVALKPAHNDTEYQAQIADLVNQVTGLNSKLVNSFMRISDLEDDLSDTQEKLTGFQINVASLEKERQEHLAALNTGLLVEKAHVSSEMQKMMERVIEETAERGKAISDKEKIESELDELSSSLFSEANKMVAVERLARARAEEKSKSTEERLRNTEEIMEQQQKRLAELQGIVEQTHKEQPAPVTEDQTRQTGQVAIPRSVGNASILPIQEERVRLDIVPYTELRAFLNHLRRLRSQLAPYINYPVPGAASGNINGVLASPIISRTNSPAPAQGRVFSGSSQLAGAPSPLGHTGTTSLSPFLAAGVARHKDFPSLPANVEQMIHLPSQMSSLAFLKRINEEDCEPCLRLDFAPGLNWLSRRQMQTAILEGNLLIEPVFGGGQYDEGEVRNRALGSPPAACAMCGKIVVNVPMPIGATQHANEGSTWISAAGNAAFGAVASSIGRDQSTSPPIGSGSFHNTSNNSSHQTAPALTTKKSSSGLFSTLRSMGSSPRPSLSPNPSTSSFTSHPAQTDNQSSAVDEDLFAAQLPPIPTHIFRVSETNNSRYLLCPDYCLQRLRVTCDFWGYIRHLERAVVLEGKLAWDDEESSKIVDISSRSISSPRLPEREKSEIVKVNLDADEKTLSPVQEGKAASEIEKANESPPDSIEKEGQAIVADREEKGEKGEEGKTEDGNVDPLTDDEDGFADAQSGGSSPKQEKIAFLEGEEVVEEGEEEGKDVRVKVEQGTTSEQKDDSKIHLPPLPSRSNISRVGSPLPPPVLPPRRSVKGQLKSKTNAGPKPRKLLPSKGDSRLTWEEKVWLEVLRHKADMWSARVGIEKKDE